MKIRMKMDVSIQKLYIVVEDGVAKLSKTFEVYGE